MPLNQEQRLLAIETALGADALVVRSVSIDERISRLFSIDAQLRSEQGEIEFDDVLGKNVTIRVELGENDTRYFNGFVSRLVQLANVGANATYRAEIVPWLWFLTRTADCRIFQNKSIPDIIEEVFKGHGFGDYELKLSGSYAPWEFCVQYRETDFNFVSRLMEEEGIYYFFEHENGKHTLIIADGANAHVTAEGYDSITFQELEAGGTEDKAITDWTIQKEVQPVTYSLNDYSFEKPKTSLRSSANTSRSYGGADFEIYDYPGEYEKPGEGDYLAQVRLDEYQSQYEVLRGTTNAGGMRTGCKFSMTDHPRSDQNRDYLITGVSMHLAAGEYASGEGAGGDSLSCQFTAIPFAQAFRPPRLTPKPIVQGPQTAVVSGPKGEEIHVDKYGRVKVQFHWDRYGKGDENSSCFIRVSQGWAGKSWGMIYTPRIGQEVIVEFLEGDPDRPIITGRVYNDAVMPPYQLPDKKAISTLKSNSTKGGGGFNEIRLDDTKGSEQLFIQGEKNQDIRIKNDCFELIGNNRHLVVGKDQFDHIKNNRNEIVDADHMEKIGKDRHLKVTGKEAKAVDESLSLTVKGDVIEVFKANHSEQTTGDYYLKAANIVIEASSNITLKVGGSTIAIEEGGIGIKTSGQFKVEATATTTIKTDADLTIQSTGPADVKSDGPLTLQSSIMAELKATIASVQSDAITKIQGGIVMIN
ncbi:MAG TPA: type VI secretion system tip protein TssI/VgrG [Verrucomicrobiae bacterium]|jgi:type VI secretion system secreted protein VgrG|nr:type VI secretion system tip protein TssI/VgrG [Verrucomicrobiae bacterium]